MTEKIPRRFFGSTGAEVSVLSLGTVKVGRNTGVKYPGGDGFTLPSDAEIDRLLGTALDLGVNLIDTAPAYGESEARLGRWLASSQERREKFLVFSKVGETYDLATQVSKYEFSEPFIQASVEESISRLKVEALDGLSLHLPRQDLHVLESSPALETLKRLKKAGKVRWIGASTTSREGGLFALPHVDYVMVSANIDYRAEWDVIEAAKRLGRGVLIKRGLRSGHLDSHGPKQCIDFLLGEPAVHSIVVGTLNPRHLADNASYCPRLQK